MFFLIFSNWEASGQQYFVDVVMASQANNSSLTMALRQKQLAQTKKVVIRPVLSYIGKDTFWCRAKKLNQTLVKHRN